MLATTLVGSSPCSAQIAWEGKLRDAHDKAKQQNKLMLLHFYTDNCIYCDRLEAGAFQDPTVAAAINENFVPVKVHGGKNPKLATLFKVSKYPTDVIVTTEGKALSHSVSPQQSNRYVSMLATTYAGYAQNATMVASAAPHSAATPQPAVQSQVAQQQVAQQPAAQQVAAQQPAAQQLAAQKLAAEQAAKVASAPVAQPSEPAATAMGMPASQMGLPTGDLPVQVATSQPQANQFMLPPADGVAAAKRAASEGVPAAMAAARLEQPAIKPAAEVAKKPELAMDGCCAVTIVDKGAWVEGKPELGVVHLGKLYLFADKAAMQSFLVDPMSYTPMLNEIDVVKFFEEKKIVKGNREWGVIDPINNRMYFFENEESMKQFNGNFTTYIKAAVQVMDHAVKVSNPGV
ncbi:thioredoxin family protein [Rhodopirellula sp. MGV]|uniref:thioredoxin family protein n=1 Tax=Rhodopirellula sp. MGV TaxID=2023130 RepID=UPI001E3C9E18|nr:DUF255 domain-containing protein [Rhodopirellula sp. MGV]